MGAGAGTAPPQTASKAEGIGGNGDVDGRLGHGDLIDEVVCGGVVPAPTYNDQSR
jgi:hypothetical protein